MGLDKLPFYQDQQPECPTSAILAHQVLSLPIWPEIDRVTIMKIAHAVREIIQNF